MKLSSEYQNYLQNFGDEETMWSLSNSTTSTWCAEWIASKLRDIGVETYIQKFRVPVALMERMDIAMGGSRDKIKPTKSYKVCSSIK